VTTSKSGKNKLFGHFSTVWDVETFKCIISLDTGKSINLSKLNQQPNWDNLIMSDLLILGSEDGIIRVFIKPREFVTPSMTALDSAFHQEVYNKVKFIFENIKE
jgi:hypothetical protein